MSKTSGICILVLLLVIGVELGIIVGVDNEEVAVQHLQPVTPAVANNASFEELTYSVNNLTSEIKVSVNADEVYVHGVKVATVDDLHGATMGEVIVMIILLANGFFLLVAWFQHRRHVLAWEHYMATQKYFAHQARKTGVPGGVYRNPENKS